ncbi:hypothetical protein [Spirosoma foliorum]|uniref:Uncharacterized protein n=1 Tax=Spirosoma foliorum TaxID=2710596 RepID=A0A7G5H2N9_9BACT|nr:hypothetical protein [Spirosoma foliorum]QMW05381.1 hypothetical protein H3H32_11055 [Spirosoma foliorum]
MGNLKHLPTHPDQLVSATGYSEFDTQTLTKREYFAAMAMQGLLASGESVADSAKRAVRAADILIEELNKA